MQIFIAPGFKLNSCADFARSGIVHPAMKRPQAMADPMGKAFEAAGERFRRARKG